jgi:glycerol-3-phosphate acyltransferase PlsY
LGALIIVLCAVIGYLLGSVNSSLIVGKLYGVDVRKHGSGNAGMTNSLRTMGKAAALLVLIGDITKGILACLAGLFIADDIGLLISGIAAVIGHNWPLYFGFKGGKGALTSITVVMMMDWRIGLIIIGVFGITVAVSRYVSLGSILGAITFPLASIFFNKKIELIFAALFMSLLVIARHHSNIDRLLKGSESKLGQKTVKTDNGG